MQGSGTITFQPGAGQNQLISDTIADEAGVMAGGYTPPTGFGTPGAWRIVKNGTGTLTLAGTNSYQGGTTIAAGTLQLGNGGTTGSVLGNVLNNGTLAFNRSNSYQFDGAISGTGAVQQSGTGTTMLTGTNTYSGGTTIAAGTLQLGNGGTTGSIVGERRPTTPRWCSTAPTRSRWAAAISGSGRAATRQRARRR